MLGRDSTRNLTIASVVALVALVLFFSHEMIITDAIAALATVAMRSFYLRWLGGITGDLIGACGELVEIAVLVTMAS